MLTSKGVGKCTILGPVLGPAVEVASAPFGCKPVTFCCMHRCINSIFHHKPEVATDCKSLMGLKTMGTRYKFGFLGLNHFVNVFQCGSEIQYPRRTLFGTLHTIRHIEFSSFKWRGKCSSGLVLVISIIS